jgi:hypothetical protein
MSGGLPRSSRPLKAEQLVTAAENQQLLAPLTVVHTNAFLTLFFLKANCVGVVLRCK